MTSKQKAILALLAAVNLLTIASLALLIARAPGVETTALPTPNRQQPTPIPSNRPAASVHPLTPTHAFPLAAEDCSWVAAQRLAQTGLSGAASTSSDGALHFDIVYALAPGQARDEAAQAIWTAFDAALAAMAEGSCADIRQIQITVLTRGSQDDARLCASVAAEDLAAYADGQLSEAALLDRVTYTVEPLP